ncbi:MAG: glycosyltransferase family 2 protein [Flavobacteriales bacterium]
MTFNTLMPLTAIIPALNEAAVIERALQSVRFADEVILIDSESTDQTAAIAKRQGARIIKRKFDNFSAQKNFAIRQASHAWVLIVDADEEVTPDLRREIQTTLQAPYVKAGYWIYSTYHFMGRRIKYSGWQTYKKICLFQRDKAHYTGLVHEKMHIDGPVGFLKNKMENYSYRSFDHYTEKTGHYKWLQAKELKEKNKPLNLFHFIVKPAFRFFHHYIIRLGFLDGIQGFILATVLAYGVFTRYVKYWLLRRGLR